MSTDAQERCPVCESSSRGNKLCMIARMQRLDGQEKWYVHDGPCQLCIDSWHSEPTVTLEDLWP